MSQFIEMFGSTDFVQLNSLVTLSKSSIMPQDGSIYTLYSFPAYDNNQTPEIVDGREIKSSKIVLEENVVLFNKLNVRLSRVWNILSLNTKNNICSSEFLPLKVKNSSVISQAFLYRILCSDYVTKKMMDCSTGTSNSQKRITPSSLMNMNVPLPSIDKQQKFTAIAEQADKSGFDGFKSQFIEMFGNNKQAVKQGVLADFCTLKAGKSVKSGDICESYEEGLYPCYGGNGRRGYVSSYSHDGIYNIIGRQGALCGNVNIVNGKFYATEHAVVVTPKEQIAPHWLYFALSGMNLNQYARGVAQPGLAVNQLEQLPFAIPSMELQKQFVFIAEQADKSGNHSEFRIAS